MTISCLHFIAATLLIGCSDNACEKLQISIVVPTEAKYAELVSGDANFEETYSDFEYYTGILQDSLSNKEDLEVEVKDGALLKDLLKGNYFGVIMKSEKVTCVYTSVYTESDYLDFIELAKNCECYKE